MSQISKIKEMKERPNTTRGEVLEMNKNAPYSNTERSTKSKRKSTSRRKHKVNTDNEIKIRQNNSYIPQNIYRIQSDPDESDSIQSDHTAINLSQTKKRGDYPLASFSFSCSLSAAYV